VIEYNGERTLEGLSKFIDSDGDYGRAAPDQVITSFTFTNSVFLFFFSSRLLFVFGSCSGRFPH
jgi:hypothetical protein